MLNMSNQYYDYLVLKLINWLNETNLSNGDKYYLLLNDLQDVNQFMQSLKDYSSGVEYYSLIDDDLDYTPISIKINGIRVIFASNDDVTSDFLVTLRNRVGTDNFIWNNSALIFISSKALDSIVGGSKSLMGTSGPFHIQTLRENLDTEIEDSSLSISEKKVLYSVIEETLIEGVQLTLNDFEDVYSMITKNSLGASDFNQLGLFNDPQLKTYKKEKEITERLTLNRELFEKVSEVHEQESTKERLEDIFEGPTIVGELNNSTTWQNTPFERAKTAYDAKEDSKKVQIDYLSEEFRKYNKNLNYWVRNEAEFKKNTLTNRRTNHFVIFSEDDQDAIEIRLPFDKKVTKDDITPRGFNFYQNGVKLPKESNITVKDSGKSLVLLIEDYKSTDILFGELKFKYRSKLQFRFYFLILPITPNKLDKIQSLFSLNIDKQFIELTENVETIQIGSGPNLSNKTVRHKDDCDDLILDEDRTYEVSFVNYEYESDEAINKEFYLVLRNQKLSFSIKEERPVKVPRNSIYIDKKRRENLENIAYVDGKIIHGSNVYYPFERHKIFLNRERRLIQDRELFMEIRENQLKSDNRKVPENVLRAYHRLYSYLDTNETLLSLENLTEEIEEYILAIIDSVELSFSTLKSNQSVPKEIENIIRIGTYIDYDNRKIYVSPLNPMQIYYYYIYDQKLEVEEVHENILKKLSATHLVPYVNINGNLFESYFDESNYRWIEYQQLSKSATKLSTYTRKIVMTKLQDYYKHFSYLFSLPESEINIRILNISDEKEILIGIVDFLLRQIDKNRDTFLDLTRVNVFIEDSSSNSMRQFRSKFNLIYQTEDSKDFSSLIEDNLSKYSNLYFSDKDIMNEIKDKINVYYQNETNNDQQYHITFYRFLDQENQSIQESQRLNRNYSLDGLSSGKVFTKLEDRYVNGFGLDTTAPKSDFISFINQWNSLLASVRDRGYENYESGKILVNNVKDIDAYLSTRELNKLFNNSSWVSFINPDVDLRYFNDKNNELFVIHYSDQSNTQTYESITVTKEIEQYKSVLNEHLRKYTEKASDIETDNIIRAFNLLNGEWLLRIIGEKSNNSNIVREKISIIAGYKNLMTLLDQPDIYWVPISLAEILRVSRMLGLDSSSDLFSAKMLNTSGETSDDLLFMGLEVAENDLQLHFVPVEVKIGHNNRSVIEKAFNQLLNTAKILKNELRTEENDEQFFTKKFYRNFFIQLYLANVEKIISNKLWDEKDYEQILEHTGRLLDDDFEISDSINNIIGDGLILSFEIDNPYRKIEFDEDKNFSVIYLTENDAYDDVKKSISEINEVLINNEKGITGEILYKKSENIPYTDSNKVTDLVGKHKKSDHSTEIIQNLITDFDTGANTNDSVNDQERDLQTTEDTKTPSVSKEPTHNTGDRNDVKNIISPIPHDDSLLDKEMKDSTENSMDLETVRVLIGKVKGSNHNLYWEYGHKGLANRHLLISGKSGQGKTYFMQTLLYELSKQNISSSVIDYTNGFTLPQLEDEFRDSVGDKLKNHIVYSDKLPINPFAKFQMDITGTGQLVEQDNNDMIDRVVSVLDFVFNLGIQQRYSLKQVITDVYEQYGDNITFTKIKEVLEEREATTLLGRIDTLISRDPFSYEKSDFSWEEVFNNKGEVHIFQLAGFQPQLQKVLTEFLLWDMYNYTTLNGSKDKPIPVLLDEAQNLDFKEASPTTKILKEGRKFGWSAWFATQTLSSIKSGGGELASLYNAAQQIHFQPTEDQVSRVADTVGSSSDKKYYENELTNLHKGEALISGPALNQGGKLVSTVEVVKVTSFENRI